MYIPGINYDRRTYGEAQEDITRFGKLAALAGGGAIAAAQSAGDQLAYDYQLKSNAVALEQTYANVGVAQQGLDLQNKWAVFDGIVGVAGSIFANVITPVYEQKAENELAESSRVYDSYMNEASREMDMTPTRVEPGAGPGDSERIVSNSDRIHEAYSTGQAKAIEEASKVITMGIVQKQQDEAWANAAVADQGKLDQKAMEWDKAEVYSTWNNQYNILGSQPSFENIATQEKMLKSAVSKGTITADVYTTRLIALHAARDEEHIATELAKVRGSTDPAAQMALLNELEAQLVDADQLQSLGAVAGNQQVGVLDNIRRNILARQDALRTQGNESIEDVKQASIALSAINIASATGSDFLATEISSTQADVDSAYQVINSYDPGSTAYTKGAKDINGALHSRYAYIGDGLLNREGAGNADAVNAYSLLVANMTAATPEELGFRDPFTSAASKKKLITDMEALAKQHRTILIQQDKVAIIDGFESQLRDGNYTPPLNGKVNGIILGNEYTMTEKEVKDSLHDRERNKVDLQSAQGVEGDNWARYDAVAVRTMGSDLPAGLAEDIGNGLSMEGPAFNAAAARLDNLRSLKSQEGWNSGQDTAIKIREKLSTADRSKVDYWDQINRDGQVTAEEQAMMIEVSKYNSGATPQSVRDSNKKDVLAEFGKADRQIEVLAKIMTKEGYDKDTIELMGENQQLLSRMDQLVNANAGSVHPLIAADQAATQALRDFGISDREGIVQMGYGNLEGKMNAGRPMPGLVKDFQQWQKEMGVRDFFKDGGVIENVVPAKNPDGTLALRENGDTIWEATYTDNMGKAIFDNSEPPMLAGYRPNPAEFEDTVKLAKAKKTADNKLLYEKGQAAVAFIYEQYPDMENDFWNPKEWGYIGTPFTGGTEMEKAQWAKARAASQGSVLPSSWWTDFDPDQPKARELTLKEEQYIRVQIHSKFDQYIGENDLLNVEALDHIRGLRNDAANAAIWNAEHNRRAYPGYLDQETFFEMYEDPRAGLENPLIIPF